MVGSAKAFVLSGLESWPDQGYLQILQCNALLNIFQVVGYNLGLRTVKKFMRTATLFFSSSVKHNVLSSEFYSICETA